jgi:hypothetical protein
MSEGRLFEESLVHRARNRRDCSCLRHELENREWIRLAAGSKLSIPTLDPPSGPFQVKSTHQEQSLFTAIPLSTAHHFPSLRGHAAKPADAPQNRAGKFVCPAYYRKLVKDMSHKPDAPKILTFPGA